MTANDPGLAPGSSHVRDPQVSSERVRASRRHRAWVIGGVAILAVVLTTLAIPLILRIATRAPGPGPWPPVPRAGVEVVDVPSTVLGRTMPALVWTPSGTAPDAALPLVVLFHGQGGDASAWFHAIGADLIAERLIDEGRIPPVMLVSAGIGNSMGIDSEPGDDGYEHGAYGTYLARELVPWLQGRYPISEDPDDHFVAGLSMGGFAALHLAFRHPERFGGVGGLSPAVALDIQPERAWLYRDETHRAANDPQRLAQHAPLGDLRVFLGYGAVDYDWIVAGTQAMARELEARDLTVLLADPPPTGHDGGTWQALTTPMMVWFLGAET